MTTTVKKNLEKNVAQETCIVKIIYVLFAVYTIDLKIVSYLLPGFIT